MEYEALHLHKAENVNNTGYVISTASLNKKNKYKKSYLIIIRDSFL